ncbi:hypothetical protein BC830DRAFT_151242 [Chytriomyces sp. MP71]|nr:hypothetical protein BC830DRAFT_151242 [Chytriomyces sp. MP71]
MLKRKIGSLLDSLLEDASTPSDPSAPFAEEHVRISDIALIARLSSFKEFQWFNKPDALAAPVCAALGWTCVGVDSLKCHECMAEWKHATGVELGAQNTCSSQLVSAHKHSCSFSTTPATQLTARNYAFPLLPRSIQRNAFLTRAKLLAKHLPTSVHVVVQPSLENRLANPDSSISICLAQLPDPLRLPSSVVSLALHGWELILPSSDAPESTSVKLICHLCTRTLTASNFTEQSRLDPIEEHRWYCPWIHVFSDNTICGLDALWDALDSLVTSEVAYGQHEAGVVVVEDVQPGSTNASRSASNSTTPKRQRIASGVETSNAAPGSTLSSPSKANERDFSSVQAARASLKELFADL